MLSSIEVSQNNQFTLDSLPAVAACEPDESQDLTNSSSWIKLGPVNVKIVAGGESDQSMAHR
jgi:hypothetical protein